MAGMVDPARLSLARRGHGFVQNKSSLPSLEQASILYLLSIPDGPLPLYHSFTI